MPIWVVIPEQHLTGIFTLGIKTGNIFSALQINPKKQQKVVITQEHHDQQKALRLAATLKPISSWADYTDEDDDEFFALVAPLPSPPPLLQLQTIEEEDNDEVGEGEDDDEEEEDEGGLAEELSCKLLVQKPSVPDLYLSKQVLTKEEQRRRGLAEIMDSISVLKLGLTCALTTDEEQEEERLDSLWTEVGLKEREKKKKEEQRRRSSQELAKTPIAWKTSQRSMYIPKTTKPSMQESRLHAYCTEVKGGVDHNALRKGAAAAAPQYTGNKTSGAYNSSQPWKPPADIYSGSKLIL